MNGKDRNQSSFYLSEFTDFFVRHQRHWFCQAYKLLGSREDALDMVQDAGLKASEHWFRIRIMDNPRAWTDRILRNGCLDVLKRRKRWHTQAVTENRASLPGKQLEAKIDLDKLLRGLDRDQMRLLELMRDGLSNEEIGARLGLLPGAVAMRKTRLIKRFSEVLGTHPRPFSKVPPKKLG
jgi:RNA polymerase sigma-70 factor (ECF subfamily)